MRALTVTTAVLLFLVCTSVATQAPMSSGAFERAIKQAIAVNSLVKALGLAEQCTTAYPNSKKCNELKQATNRLLAAQWRQHLSSVASDNLPELERSLAQIERAEPDPAVSSRLASVRAELQAVNNTAADFVKRLHDPTAAVPAALPSSLSPYAPYISEMSEASRELALHQALQSAKNLHAAGRTLDAIKNLDALKPDAEVAAVRRDMEAASNAAVSENIDSSLAPDSWDGIIKALEQLVQPEAQLLPDATRQTFQSRISDALKRRAHFLIPRDADISSSKAISRILAAKMPPQVGLAVEWTQLGLTPPGFLISAETSGIHQSCEGLSSATLLSRLRDNLSPLLQEESGATVKITIEDVRCAMETGTTGEEPINSTYVASYQQVTNPEYVRLQALLQQARQELADLRARNAANRTTSAWAGAAQGFAEGLAENRVSTLARLLVATPPFLSQPVALSYTPYRYYIERSAAIKAVLSIADQTTGYAEAVTLTAKASAKADGMRGVLPTDQSKLSNRTPDLQSNATLIGQASSELVNDAAAHLKKYSGQIAMKRAQRAAHSQQPTVSAGYLLLASDFGVLPEEQGPLALLLQQLETLPLERLNELKLPPVPSRIATAAKPAVRPPLAATSRVGMLEQALSAVVTISTERGSGSGFFVGSKGQVVTNAHVVDGATRIIVRTRSKDSVLAKVLKLSLVEDLALLTTAGLDVSGLPLGDASSASVGQDVIAIGSPLGLEGTVTRGIISGIRQIDEVPYLQTDAPINPGNSGGPLLSERGEVLGINTWKVGKQAEALGFAISVDRMKSTFAGVLDLK
jgi:Trypsin-like peptidase domain